MYKNIKVASSIACFYGSPKWTNRSNFVPYKLWGHIYGNRPLEQEYLESLVGWGGAAIHFMQSPKSGPLKVIVSDISVAVVRPTCDLS